jgi:hypothetical protein
LLNGAHEFDDYVYGNAIEYVPSPQTWSRLLGEKGGSIATKFTTNFGHKLGDAYHSAEENVAKKFGRKAHDVMDGNVFSTDITKGELMQDVMPVWNTHGSNFGSAFARDLLNTNVGKKLIVQAHQIVDQGRSLESTAQSTADAATDSLNIEGKYEQALRSLHGNEDRWETALNDTLGKMNKQLGGCGASTEEISELSTAIMTDLKERALAVEKDVDGYVKAGAEQVHETERQLVNTVKTNLDGALEQADTLIDSTAKESDDAAPANVPNAAGTAAVTEPLA